MAAIQHNLKKLHEGSRILSTCSQETINMVLVESADALVLAADKILSANRKDLKKMSEADPKYDRLRLTPERIKDMADGLKALADMQSPVGEVMENRMRPNGLQVTRVRVPIGVIGMIYEARPNVTTDAFGIAFKTQNAIALKGSEDAHATNQALVGIIQRVLKKNAVSENVVYLLPAKRSAVGALLKADGLVDVIIPRGSQGLITYVRKQATVPVIETGAGVVHTYFDVEGSVDIGKHVILSAKTRRPSVCNALDTLLIHERRLSDLPALVTRLAEKKVIIYADQKSFWALAESYPKELLKKAKKEHFGKEFLDFAMSIKTVASLDDALKHIAAFSSRHSEAIITDNAASAERFLNEVDAACVYHNTETGFSDGAEFGLGAEIGISTQKLHARGPMGLAEMTSYKWVVRGNGQTRMKIK